MGLVVLIKLFPEKVIIFNESNAKNDLFLNETNLIVAAVANITIKHIFLRQADCSSIQPQKNKEKKLTFRKNFETFANRLIPRHDKRVMKTS